jgi:ATP-dependent DNA helicase DinG
MPAATTFAEAQEVLAAALPGYTRREHQIALASVIEEAIGKERPLLAQAGTGTGKSLALLIPAILSGKRTVVATATKVLQGQYSQKDLPFLEEYLGTPFTWAVLKGRSNYPCHARAEELAAPTALQATVKAAMQEHSTPDAVRDGVIIDRETFPALTEDEWKPFSMSAAECPGRKECPFAEVCFAERAKAKAEAADVVITNIAYLLTDLLLRNQTDGNVALLGDFDLLVVDEAHVLPDQATGALEDTMGEGTFARLSRDMGGYIFREGGDETVAGDIERAAAELWRSLTRAHAAFAAKARSKSDPMPLMITRLIMEFGNEARTLYQAIEATREEIKSTQASDDRSRIARSRLLRRSMNQMQRLEAYLSEPDEKIVRWAEEETSKFRGETRTRIYLRSAPVSVAPFLRTALWDKVPAILSSATLAAGSDFSYLAETLGLREDEALTYDAGSPFDYPRQALLYVPGADAPEPTARTNAAWRVYAQEVTHHLVQQSGGGALLLFTSRSAMNESYQAIAGRLQREGLTVLRQGDSPSGELIRVMKEDGHAVLFALRTFFEGVDIQGSALRLVVLDKLPFAVPSDLVYQARSEVIERRGQSAFGKMAMPMMILILTQAFGRLIRHRDDRGVVAILDNRLMTKGYGSQIMKALPPARRTSDIEEAARFLAASR